MNHKWPAETSGNKDNESFYTFFLYFLQNKCIQRSDSDLRHCRNTYISKLGIPLVGGERMDIFSSIFIVNEIFIILMTSWCNMGTEDVRYYLTSDIAGD